MTQPTNHAETMTGRYGNALMGAGIATGLAALLIVLILTYGGWPQDLYGQIVTILGNALMGAGTLMVLVIIFLGPGGPVRKLKAVLSKLTIETEGD